MYNVGGGKSLVGTGTISVSTETPKLLNRFFDFSEPINCSGRLLMRVMRSGGLTLQILGKSALASGCLSSKNKAITKRYILRVLTGP